MIRNHRPRGYRWTCPSDFQQTPAFRHIRYDDCLAPEDGILLAEDEDEFPESERAAKRRRVEHLADGFLNGLSLEIHSARLDPDALRIAVAYSSFPRPKDFSHAIGDIETQNDSAELWEDVEDDREMFQRLRGAKQANSNDDDDSGVFIDGTVLVEEVEVTEVEVQASCGPKRRLRSTKVTVGPSEEALRVAAALRDRTLRQTITALPVESQPHSCPPSVIAETQGQSFETSTDETASDCGPSPTPAWTSSKWLKTGAFKPQKHVDEDCSRDELGASSMFTLSQKSRTRERPLARGNFAPSTAPSATAQSMKDESFASRVQQSQGPGSSSAVPAQYDDSSVQIIGSTDFQPAPQEHGGSSRDGGSSQEDSQSRLLRRQGLRIAPRKSWVAMKDISEHTEEPTFIDPDEADPRRNGDAVNVNDAEQGSLTQDRLAKGRKMKCTGNVPTDEPRRLSSRRKSGPSESQDMAATNRRAQQEEEQYLEVEVNGFSPLVLRKRRSKLSKQQTTETASLQPAEPAAKNNSRRAACFSSSSPGKSAPALALVPSAEPHTPLVDEHLNTILPQIAGSDRRSSAVRRALREELEASGAELSRSGDQASSQPEPTREMGSNETEEEDDAAAADVSAVSETQWPGTQAMLAQAQCDMFTSPDKSDTPRCLGDKTARQVLAARTNPSRSTRKPLNQLSQEPVALPSTQALLLDWQPWSSIKKPGITRDSLDASASPFVAEKRTPRSVFATSLPNAKSPAARSASASIRESANRRRSSLRFSMSFSDSPEKADCGDAPSLVVEHQPKAASQPIPLLHQDVIESQHDTVSDIDTRSPKKTTRVMFSSMRLTSTQRSPVAGRPADGFSRPPPRRSSSGLNSSLSFGISSLDLPVYGTARSQDHTILPPDSQEDSQTLMTSYQHAQVLADENSQELARTITEVTTGVLGTAGTFTL